MDGLRKALIVANDVYEHEGLRHLLAPAADARALAGVLGDTQIGDFDVQVLRNEPAHVIEGEIEDLFSDSRPEDVLLLHFSCHGLKSESGELFFAARTTRPNRLGSTAVSADFVQRCMRMSRSRSIVLLLDCCYGGAFSQGVTVRATGDVDVLDRFPVGRLGGGRGRAVITASSAMEYAFEGDQLADDHSRRPSVFTSALVEGLATGDADRDQDGWVSLNELYDYVFDRVREQNPHQTPGRAVEMQGELYLARRSRPVTTPAPLPAELLEVVDHPLAGVRGGAVRELAELLQGRHAGLALAARMTLERLAHDDSRTVAAAAAVALDAADTDHASAHVPAPAGSPAPEPPAAEEARTIGPPEAAPPAPEAASPEAQQEVNSAEGGPAPVTAHPPVTPPPDRPVPARQAARGRRRRRLLLGGAVAGVAAVTALVVGVLSFLRPSSTPPDSGVQVVKVGLVFNSDGTGDLADNDYADRGAAQAEGKYGDRLAVERVTLNREGSNRKELLDGLVTDGVKLIFAVNNFSSNEDVATSAKKHPEVTYVLVDGYNEFCDKRENLVCVAFKNQESSFLVGAAAALKSSSHVVGFVGGEPANVEWSRSGYQAGVRYVDERRHTRTRVLVDYTNETAGSAAQGKKLALKQISQHADVIYHDASDASKGVIEACAAMRRYAIGNYFDASQWYPDERSWILTSAVARVDEVVARGIDRYRNGSLEGAGQVYAGVADNGVDYARNQYNKNLLGDIPLTLEDIKKKIISGAIHVPNEPTS